MFRRNVLITSLRLKCVCEKLYCVHRPVVGKVLATAYNTYRMCAINLKHFRARRLLPNYHILCRICTYNRTLTKIMALNLTRIQTIQLLRVPGL
jgi:hypothetical protein